MKNWRIRRAVSQNFETESCFTKQGKNAPDLKGSEGDGVNKPPQGKHEVWTSKKWHSAEFYRAMNMVSCLVLVLRNSVQELFSITDVSVDPEMICSVCLYIFMHYHAFLAILIFIFHFIYRIVKGRKQNWKAAFFS